MAISRWCSKCSTDNSTSNKVCSKCSASLSHGKHRERHKVNGRWKSRVFTLGDTHATLLANMGTVSLQTIQKLLGHSTIELTQSYAHLLDKTMREAVDLL